VRELVARLAYARLCKVTMPLMAAGHRRIGPPPALVGPVLAVAEAARYGQGGQRLRGSNHHCMYLSQTAIPNRSGPGRSSLGFGAHWIEGLIMTREQDDVDDPYGLGRFIDAQNLTYEKVCAELRAGRKQGHWMWFIFPQLKGLGHSQMANKFAISSRQEAEAYLKQQVLGPRLRECTRLVTLIEGRSITQILGYPDDLKFRSCMTLFASTAPENEIFKEAIQKYFSGEPDHQTIAMLG
jgi:uncharacterized protein (DUF1810 family)